MNPRRGGPQRPSLEPTAFDQVLRKARRPLGAIFLFQSLVNILRLTIPLFMLQIFDRVLSSGNYSTLLYLTLVALFALLVGAILSGIVRIILRRLGTWVEAALLEPTATSVLDGETIGRSHGAVLIRDLAQVRGVLGGQFVTTILDLPWVPVFVAVMCLLNIWTGLITLAVVICLVLLGWAADATTPQSANAQDPGRVAKEFETSVRNVEVVQSMGMVPVFTQRLTRLSGEMTASKQIAGDRESTFTTIARAVRQISQVVVLAVGAYLVLEGDITSGIMLASSLLLSQTLAPVEQSVAAWRAMQGFLRARRRIQDQLRGVTPRPSNWIAMPKPIGRLELHSISYIPPQRAVPILRNVNFALEAGDTLAIIGSAGAGKSTLCRVITGATKPTGGYVTIDNVDLHQRVSNNIGRHFGYLPQEAVFFSASIAENIARLAGSTEPLRNDQVVAAARRAGVHDAILNLPQAYETVLDETVRLSRSEIQRIGLARALYGEPSLLVLDEPASFLDRAGESTLVSTIEELQRQGVTIAMVTQRPALMDVCTKALLLRKGTVAAFGQAKSVLAELQSRPNAASVHRLPVRIA